MFPNGWMRFRFLSILVVSDIGCCTNTLGSASETNGNKKECISSCRSCLEYGHTKVSCCRRPSQLTTHRDVVDSSGVAYSEISFMLAESLKKDWPQQYITYLEAKLLFEADESPHLSGASRRGDVTSAGTGAELVLWKAADD